MARPLVPRLKRLELRTLVLWGEFDAWLPPRIGEELASAIPGARLEHVPDAGHFAQEDNPAGFADAVATLLTQVGYV